jgi:hypothetical protein
MYEIVVVSICQLLRRGMGDFGKNERGERGGCGCCRGGMFAEDGGMVGNTGAV